MVKVKLSTQHPNWPLRQQFPSSKSIWGEYQFFINDEVEDCDYWIVCEGLLKRESTLCPPENTILITWEPPSIKSYSQNFLNQFERLITCHKNLKHKNITYSHQGLPWHVRKSYDEITSLKNIKKTKNISIISSNKKCTDSHKKRIEFAYKIKDYFKDDIDLYGRGINDFEDKWDVLAPYKYSIAIENSVLDHYITEKLSDCYLAHTFPFYHGASNVYKYYNKESFARIDISNFNKTISTIEKVLNDNNHYNTHIGHLSEARDKYMNKWQLFPLIVNFVELCEKKTWKQKKVCTIEPDSGSQSLKMSVITRLSSFLLNPVKTGHKYDVFL